MFGMGLMCDGVDFDSTHDLEPCSREAEREPTTATEEVENSEIGGSGSCGHVIEYSANATERIAMASHMFDQRSA